MLEAPENLLRRTIQLVLTILGLLVLAGRADASGCHAPERPTFGLNNGPLGELGSPIPDPGTAVSSPVQYRQTPCPDESAGLPSKLEIPRASASIPAHFGPMIGSESRSIEPAPPLRFLSLSNPLERPPRDLLILSSR